MEQQVTNNPVNTNNNPNDQTNDKGMAYIAYIIFFIPLLMGNRSQFVNYHTNQGTVLFIFSVGLSMLLSFLLFIPILGLLFQFALIIPFILWVMGIINVSNGVMKPLPLIGGITLIK